MYIEAVPNRNSPPAILLRESYREGGKVRKRTLCNLSDWPTAHIEGLRGVLKGGTVIPAERDAFTVIRSLPHGHVAAALGTARKIGLDRILGPDSDRCRDLILALLVGRILDPASKLATARALSPATAASSLGELLGLGEVDEDELYHALDGPAGGPQPAIEATLAKRHLTNGTLALEDVVIELYGRPSCLPARQTWLQPPGRGKKGTLQIVYGLLCAPDGCPIAIEVFEGNTADPMTLATQIEKLEGRFQPRARRSGRRPRHGHPGAHHRGHQVGRLSTGISSAARTRDQGTGGRRRVAALRCSISATWPPLQHPTSPASAWWFAATPISPPSAPASAKACWPATERDLCPRFEAAVARRRDPLRGTANVALAARQGDEQA